MQPVEVFSKPISFYTLYKSSKNNYFMSISHPSLLFHSNGTRFTTEYLAITERSGKRTIYVEKEDNYLMDIKDYADDKRILAFDFTALMIIEPSLRDSLDKFNTIVEMLEPIMDGLVALVYLHFSNSVFDSHTKHIPIEDIIENSNNNEWIKEQLEIAKKELKI
jgi:hypothetical protein